MRLILFGAHFRSNVKTNLRQSGLRRLFRYGGRNTSKKGRLSSSFLEASLREIVIMKNESTDTGFCGSYRYPAGKRINMSENHIISHYRLEISMSNKLFLSIAFLISISGCGLNDPDFNDPEPSVISTEDATRWQVLLDESIQAFRNKDIEKAENRIKELELFTSVFPEDDARRAITLMSIASFYDDTDRYDEAEPRYRDAYDIIPRIYGVDSINMAMCCDSLARLSALRKQYPEAERLLNKALVIYEKLEDDIQIGLTFGKLADVHRSQNRYETSKQFYIAALNKLSNDSNNEANVVSMQFGLGLVHTATQSYSDAIPLFNQVLSYFEKTLGVSDPRLAVVLNGLADAYIGLENFDAAENTIKRIIEILKLSSGEQSQDYQLFLKKLSSVYSAQKRYEEAEALLNANTTSGDTRSTDSVSVRLRADRKSVV